MGIALGEIQFEEPKLYKQLRNDLRDDWFPDPILYSDMIDGGIVQERITDNFDRNHGSYEACDRSLFDIPKPNFTLRYALEIGLEDRAIYHGICSYLIKHFDPLIPWYVFSHRQNQNRPSDRYMFRNGVWDWRDFTEAVRSEVDPTKHLLSTDLNNYFENIDIDVLKSCFSDLIPKLQITSEVKSCVRSHLRLLFDCLNKWSYDGRRGLAQNRDASSFLANIYMLYVDQKMRAGGFKYFRYMDDIKIICANKLEARRALKELIIHLREIGLAVNAKKTVIADGAIAADIAECLDTAAPQIERLGSIWQTKKREVIARSFPELRNFAESLLINNKIDSRDFRFCISRLIVLASCIEFAVPPAFFRRITELLIERLCDSPASTDQFLKYLRVVELSGQNLQDIADYICDVNRNFYGWQCYLLWILLAERGYKEKNLFRHALKCLDEPEGPNRIGATLYVGASGSKAGRRRIARSFGTLQTFIGQRIAIIALHELPFNAGVKQHVANFVRSDLVGVYRGLKSRKGVYVTPPAPLSISAFIDAERDYAS